MKNITCYTGGALLDNTKNISSSDKRSPSFAVIAISWLLPLIVNFGFKISNLESWLAIKSKSLLKVLFLLKKINVKRIKKDIKHINTSNVFLLICKKMFNLATQS